MENHRRRTQVTTSDDEDEQEKEEVLKRSRPVEDAKPIGEPLKYSGKGKSKKWHYDSFEFNGIQYTIVNSFFSLILHNLGILRLQTCSDFNFVSAGGSCSFQTRGKGPKAICWNY